jgi:hypothetical protein
MTVRFILTGTAAAGAAMSAWRMISHVLLPWHAWTTTIFTNGEQVLETVRTNAERNGVYLINEGVFAVVDLLPGLPDRTRMIGGRLAMQLAIDLAVGFLLALALLGLNCRTVTGRAGFMAMLGVAAGAAIHASHWNWYGFGAAYTIVNALDLAITWFIGGLVLALLARGMPPRTTAA